MERPYYVTDQLSLPVNSSFGYLKREAAEPLFLVYIPEIREKTFFWVGCT